MVKKVTAPKTYNPGKGRPREHLAYLNEREMAYLRGINGNNMERGPRGLPSFPPDDSLGSSSSTSRAGQGGGGKTGGSSGSSGGATGGGSKGAPSSGRASAAKAPTAPSPKAPTAPTSPMSGQKTSFSSPRAASSYNKDVALKTGLEKNNAISAVKNTPAIKNDGVTGFKAQSLGVKPIGKTTIGGSRPASPIGPANRDMEVNRNLDRIARDFYNSDPDYQKGLAQQRATVAKSRESVGLLGKGVSPRDTISSPARTAPSTGMTQSEKQALLDKYNPVKAAGRLSDAVSSAASKIYNDPVGTASSGLNSLSDYLRDSYNTIAAGSLSSDPDLRSAAAEKAAEIALNYGIGGLGTSFATKAIPENSLGMFVAPRASQDLWDVAEMGKSLQRRGATEADIFNETAKKTRSGVSGYQKISTPEGETWGFEVSAPLNVRQEIIDRVDPSLLGRVKDATFGKLIGKNSQVKDVVDTSDLDEFYGGEFSRTPVEQMYNPSQLGFYNPAGTLGGYNIAENKIAINNPMTQGIFNRPGELSSEYFSPVMVHEGQHAFSALDKRAKPTKIPQGTGLGTEAERIRRSLEVRGLSMPEKEIQKLAEDAYWSKPGEVLSQLAEKRRLNSPQSMKSFDERIAAENAWNRSFEHRARVERILRELQDKKRGWRSAWDTIVLE